MDGGFIDLRQGGSDNGAGTDSFWPSFTDIMMVVVMIFMIASTALMLRNWELVEELRATIIAEMQAEELARSMTETSATLEEQLAQAQHENTQLRIQRMRMNERIEALETRLAARDQRVLELETDNQKLAASLQKYRRDALLNDDQLKQTQDELATLQQRLDEVLVELSEGEEARQQQSAEMAALRLGSSLTEQQLLTLQTEYSELQVKYDKLFKPARSAKGKHVVTVRYRKEGNAYKLHIKESEEADYTEVSREELHRRLGILKDKYANLLYVKLIIPDDSGLSYNEAWGFTVEMLDKYDYYHQK